MEKTMTLRLRLLLGYGYLVALLLASTGSAMLGFLHLSEIVEVILDDNFESVRSAMQMVEALERQDSATLAALLEGRAEVPEMEEHERAFVAALNAAEDNVTEGPEVDVVARTQLDFVAYREARDELLAAQPSQPLRGYNRDVFPAFTRVKRDVFELLNVNHRAMIEADRRTRESAIRNGAWLGLLVTVALVSLVLLSRALQRHVLAPVSQLRHGMSDITGGNLGRRLSEREGGELGAIARHFNTLLDRLQSQESRLQGRVRQERQAVLALARRLGPEVTIYDLSGRRIAGEGESTRHLGPRLPAPVTEWIEREDGREGAAAGGRPLQGVVEVDGQPFRVELLHATRERPMAWLLEPVGEG